ERSEQRLAKRRQEGALPCRQRELAGRRFGGRKRVLPEAIEERAILRGRRQQAERHPALSHQKSLESQAGLLAERVAIVGVAEPPVGLVEARRTLHQRMTE